MRKILLTAISVLFAVSVSAAKGDEVWKSITNWSDYCPHGEFGGLKGMALYDIDSDGINECIIIGEDGNAVLTCGDGKGNYGQLYIKMAVNSIPSTSICIVKNKPYVINDGSCGAGCHLSEYYKIEKSRPAIGYQMVETFNPADENAEPQKECAILKSGETPTPVSYEEFRKNLPPTTSLLTVTALNVKSLAKPSSAEAVRISHLKNTLHDANDYFYEILSDKEVAVAKGGAYMGDIVIPENIICEGRTYKVTTVRREAFYNSAEAHNISDITSITLPASVTLIGADAFRNNPLLKTVNYNPKARIEVRSFWGCPNLKLNRYEPKYAFTGFFDSEVAAKGERIEAMSTFYMPCEKPDDVVESYQWALHKYHHNGIFFREWANMNTEDAMTCYSVDVSHVRGGIFYLLSERNVETMFKGNMNPLAMVVLADNSYVATHEFMVFSRWMFGEKETPAPADFKQAMAAKYGKKIKYSYEVGKIADTDEKLIITEFAIKNKKAHVVLSWLRNGKEVCSYSITQEVEGDTNESVWNVDDDGNYGIPELLTVARDEHGNIELFLHHPAPESRNFMHLVQKGNKFELAGEDGWYVWY